ncbi:MAG: O-antigen ligase family protein [Phycisphaerae bacterium]|nr:O-antigen ligase family protein [Phycisphaerae bacterium]
MPLDSNLSKSKGQVILEYITLALCLCVIALRATYTEGPAMQSISPSNLNNNLYSLSVSAVLFFAFTFWLTYSFCSKRFLYRITAVEIGLFLFCIAAVIAAFAASNKRAAITDAACLIAPVLMAILLVQILDSPSKIKLVLVVIAALGVVSAYQCTDQFLTSNQAMIDQYEKDPQTILEPLGIQSSSFQQFLFEHRLYSKDVRGFFTTGNSAGSSAILASFAALALFIDKLKNRQSALSLIACGLTAAVVIFGLIITRSKGAISASLIAAVLFVAFLCFGNWLQSHKKAVLLVCLLLSIVLGFALVSYGLNHDRLPGGNSMLVRWQYWLAAAKMYADHPFTGVGPGNFANFYTHYKAAAALESVADPHNFLLTILTQYGPLGLVGFLALFFIPLWKSFPGRPGLSPQVQPQVPFGTLAAIYLPVLSVALLLIRPLVMRTPTGDTFEVAMYLIFTLYVAPLITFIVGFWLLTASQYAARSTQHAIRGTSIISAALFCAVLGLLLHNLIDFAIFEPPVFTALCAIVACLIASNSQQTLQPILVIKLPLPVRIILAASCLLLIWGFFNYALVPVAKTSKLNQQAVRQNIPSEYAHLILYLAAEMDPLDPTALNLNGRLYLQNYKETPNAQPALLKKAEACFLAAIARDNADFKNYEKLSEVYTLLTNSSPVEEKTDLLDYSFDCLLSAAERYPTSDRLRFELAEVSEQLGKTDIAVAQYEKAVEIEDAYRNQFKIMYPGREIFSRLGEENYQKAKQRIKQLSGQPAR